MSNNQVERIVSEMDVELKRIFSADIQNLVLNEATMEFEYKGKDQLIEILVNRGAFFIKPYIYSDIRKAIIGDLADSQNKWNFAYKWYLLNAKFKGTGISEYAEQFGNEEKTQYWLGLPLAVRVAILDLAG